MIRRPPRSTRSDTLFPYTTLFRSLFSLVVHFQSLDGEFRVPMPAPMRICAGAQLMCVELQFERRLQREHVGQGAEARDGPLRRHADIASVAEFLAPVGVGEVDLYHRDCDGLDRVVQRDGARSEEHTSEIQSLMRISYAVFCLKKK